MEKKEFHRRQLPHFQQSGQAYFVTWCIKDAVPSKALESFTNQMKSLHSLIEIAKTNKAKENILIELKIELSRLRKKYMKALDDLLHIQTKFIVNLSEELNTKVLLDALCYWEGIRIENYAISAMPNHVHWVLRLFDKDETGNPVY
jgi:putative transposase